MDLEPAPEISYQQQFERTVTKKKAAKTGLLQDLFFFICYFSRVQWAVWRRRCSSGWGTGLRCRGSPSSESSFFCRIRPLVCASVLLWEGSGVHEKVFVVMEEHLWSNLETRSVFYFGLVHWLENTLWLSYAAAQYVCLCRKGSLCLGLL